MTQPTASSLTLIDKPSLYDIRFLIKFLHLKLQEFQSGGQVAETDELLVVDEDNDVFDHDTATSFLDKFSSCIRILQYFEEKMATEGCVRTTYTNNGLGRMYCHKEYSMQCVKRVIRHTLCKGRQLDVDMVNCQPVLLQQYCEKNGVRCPQLDTYIKSREMVLKVVMKADGCDRETAKQRFLQLMFGGRLITKSDVLAKFGDEMSMIIEAVSSKADKRYIEAAEQSEKKKQKEEKNLAKKEGREPKTFRSNIGGCTMAQLLNDIENNCLMAMVSACKKSDIDANVTALCFDGFLVDNKWGEDVDQVEKVLRRLEDECFKATGYNVTLLVKKMDRALTIQQGLDLESSGSLDYSNVDFSLPHNQRFLTNLANALPKPLTPDRISALRRIGLQQKPNGVTDEGWDIVDQGVLTLHDLRLALFSHLGYDKHQHWCHENVLVEDQTEALLLNDVAGLSVLISQLLKGRCKVTQDLKSSALWNDERRLWMRVNKIDALTLEICKELIPIVERYVDHANTILASKHHSFCVLEQTKVRNLQNRRGDPMAVSKCDRLQSLLDRVRNGVAVNQIIRQVVLPLRDDGFFENLDRSPDTLPISGGLVVILRTTEVRQRTVDDRWSFELPWSFSRDPYEYIPPPAIDCDNDMKPVERINPDDILDVELRHFAIHYPNGFMFFARICQHDYEYVKSFLQIIGYLISGETCRREMYVWYGGGRNGKSTLMKILKVILGPLMGTAHPSLLSHEAKDPNAHTAAYNNVINAHLVNTSEGSEDTVLTAAVVKRNFWR